MLLCSSFFNHSSVHYLFISLKSNHTKSNNLNTIVKPLSLERWSIALSTREWQQKPGVNGSEWARRGGCLSGKDRAAVSHVSPGTNLSVCTAVSMTTVTPALCYISTTSILCPASILAPNIPAQTGLSHIRTVLSMQCFIKNRSTSILSYCCFSANVI